MRVVRDGAREAPKVEQWADVNKKFFSGID